MMIWPGKMALHFHFGHRHGIREKFSARKCEKRIFEQVIRGAMAFFRRESLPHLNLAHIKSRDENNRPERLFSLTLEVRGDTQY